MTAACVDLTSLGEGQCVTLAEGTGATLELLREATPDFGEWAVFVVEVGDAVTVIVFTTTRRLAGAVDLCCFPGEAADDKVAIDFVELELPEEVEDGVEVVDVAADTASLPEFEELHAVNVASNTAHDATVPVLSTVSPA